MFVYNLAYSLKIHTYLPVTVINRCGDMFSILIAMKIDDFRVKLNV